MVILAADGGAVGGGAAQRAAKAELERREYHRDDPGLVSRALHWLGHRLGRLFSGTGGDHALLIVLVVVLVVVVLLAVRAGVPTRAQRLVTGADLDPLAPVDARDHRRIAARLAAEGRRAEAVREWLRAAVATIEERGVLPPRPGRTGAATAREAGPLLPSAADDLRAATTAFDEIWFGGRAAVDADVTRARAAADGVRSARIAAPTSSPGIAAPW
jgi:hypothetical protein